VRPAASCAACARPVLGAWLAMGREDRYLATRDTAWARYRELTSAASLAYQQGEIAAGQLMVIRDREHATLDDTLTAAQKAAGYQPA